MTIALNTSFFSRPFLSFTWPFKRKEYDLRHFEWTQCSTAWDGRSRAEDGWTVRTLHYQGQPVYSEAKKRLGSFSDGRIVKQGNEKLVVLAALGTTLVQLHTILRQLAGCELIDTLIPSITITPEYMRMLTEHSQYSELKEKFRDKGWVFQFRKEEGHSDLYMVTAVKVA